jgi:hypothetical protein
MQRQPSFFLCLAPCQRLGQPDLKIGPPLLQRAIEDTKAEGFVWFQFIDIAVSEDTGGERQLNRA